MSDEDRHEATGNRTLGGISITRKRLVLWLVGALILGNVMGFFIGVAVRKGGLGIGHLLSGEKAADLAHPQKLAREGYRLTFPGNWRVDTSDEEYDPDHFFSLDSPGASFAMFTILEVPTDPEQNVDVNVSEFVPNVIRSPVRTTFMAWGNYQGYGVELKGKVASLVEGGVRIFSYSSERTSFIVVESYHDEDREKVEPGFQLIRSTFELSERDSTALPAPGPAITE